MKVVLCCLDGENLVGSHKTEPLTNKWMPTVSPRGIDHLLFVVVGV